MTNEELVAHLQETKKGTDGAADILAELWTQNEKLVKLTIHRFTGLSEKGENSKETEDFKDMVQQAYFAFHAAAYSFDASKGLKFSTHFTSCIQWSLARYYEYNGFLVRVPYYVRNRIKRAEEMQRELEAESGRRVTMREALEALNLPQKAIEGTLKAHENLKTASLDAEAYTTKDGDGVSLLDKLSNGEDVAELVNNQVWLEDLHRLEFKALRELPEAIQGVIIRHYFNGVSLAQQAKEKDVTRAALWEREYKAFQAIRAGKYGAELAEYCETSSKKKRAERLIKQDIEELERLKLSEDEKGLLAL